MARDTVMNLALTEIVVPINRRPLDGDAVKRLAQSIKQVGLRHPITVRSVGGKFDLVAGHHRLEAFRRLGEELIPAEIAKVSDIDARLWEIAENLHRAELTVQQRADQVAEWVRLTEEKKGAQLAPPGGRQPNDTGIKAASRDLGMERTDIQRSVKIAGITDEAKEAAREAGLDDNQSALLKVARAAPSRQVEVVSDIAEAKALKVQQDVQNRAANEIAEILVEGLDRDAVEAVRVNLGVTTAKAITAALANLLGQSIMDRRYGTEG